jgi:hypothetical protein
MNVSFAVPCSDREDFKFLRQAMCLLRIYFNFTWHTVYELFIDSNFALQLTWEWRADFSSFLNSVS